MAHDNKFAVASCDSRPRDKYSYQALGLPMTPFGLMAAIVGIRLHWQTIPNNTEIGITYRIGYCGQMDYIEFNRAGMIATDTPGPVMDAAHFLIHNSISQPTLFGFKRFHLYSSIDEQDRSILTAPFFNGEGYLW